MINLVKASLPLNDLEEEEEDVSVIVNEIISEEDNTPIDGKIKIESAL